MKNFTAAMILVFVYWQISAGETMVAWSGTFREIRNDVVYFKELNITQAETSVQWKFVERVKGKYEFKDLRMVIDMLEKNGIDEIALAVYPENPLYIDVRKSRKTVPQNGWQWAAYKNFLSALVKEFRKEVRYYQIVREINPARFLGSAEDYAGLLEFSYDIIKSVDREAKIIFSALPYELRNKMDRQKFLPDVIRRLPGEKKYFDAIDIHFHGLPVNEGGPLSYKNGARNMALAFDYYKDQLRGTKYEDTLIFFETSSYSAGEGDINGLPAQTETQQAEDLKNRLTVLSEKGAYWINLEGGIYQRKYFLFSESGEIKGSNTSAGRNNPLKFFEYTGLVWNPDVNKGMTGKKQAFDVIKKWNNE
ncbi:MAG: hypothetical protein JW969_20490 [Spirochaetales bacterium]|nr:hypothetical protein [Spirochaetales bacterium]